MRRSAAKMVSARKRADLIVGRTPPNEPVPDYDALLGQGVRGLRIGVIRHFYTKDVVGDPEQVQALDEAVCLETPIGLGAIGFYYRNFHQMTDAEVTKLLARAPLPN